LDQQGRVNAVLVGGKEIEPLSDDAAAAAETTLADALRPRLGEDGQPSGLTLDDFGVQISRVTQDYKNEQGDAQTVFDYFSVTTNRMLFSPESATAIEQAVLPFQGQPIFTYLANTIAKASKPSTTDDAASETNDPDAESGIPYSLVTAVDSTPAFDLLAIANDANGQPLPSDAPPLEDDEILLNSWAANDLRAQIGDTIRISYFEPETAHGDAVERSSEFRLRGIVPLTEPLQGPERRRSAVFDKPPTLANDPRLTPEVEGFTDQRTIREADPPFPFDRDRIRQPTDDDYWDFYLTTPKAFLSLEAGQQIWGSRFGVVTSYRVPASEDLTEQKLSQAILRQLGRDQQSLGFDFIAIKQRQMAASSGTTPFDGLFIGLSFFVIVAALMLVALLFRLGLEQRAAEVGTLVAVGIERRRVTRWLIAEGTVVAAFGALVGVALGMGYAWLMLAGLRSWWVGAIVTPFLQFYYTPRSLLLGWGLGVLTCAATIGWSARQMRRVAPRQLLAGRVNAGLGKAASARRWPAWVALGLLLAAGGMAFSATSLGGEAQAGAFVGAGAAVLAAALLWVWSRLQAESAWSASGAGLGISRLAASSARRNPSRSTMSVGLIAAASFLIVAMSAFQLDPSLAGAGGFNLYAESSQPVFVNLNDPADRRELLSDDELRELADTTVISLRVKPGDDASCTNLYRPTQPRVLGVTPQMIQHFDQADARHFAWAGSAAEDEATRTNPWHLLSENIVADEAGSDAVPVVLDKNTAMYSLQMYGGIGEEKTFTYDNGKTLRVKVVGLLSNSIFQGSLLIGESAFRRQFPEVSGYGYFLIDTPEATQREVSELLESRLSDQGFDARGTFALLDQLLAVQNTYLKTFQALGALGLLLGTFGLSTVQLRSVLERRGELAVMRATGFRRQRLASMVMLENVLLLVAGLATGVFAALVAVLPHMIFGEASVPFGALGIMLGIIVIVGVISGLAGVWATLRAPLVAALRGD
ncbi:MAG: FtsX-like permease family protein, partial [Planctomycetales bacterium]|nr:FtsX-like permease family protein [Planctomycetales bacterium]